MTTNKLTVPSTQELARLQELCDLTTPYSFSDQNDQLFVKAMAEAVRWHAERNRLYARLIEKRRFDPGELRTIDDCASVPFILANFFKSHEVVSVDRQAISVHLTSSGTTGQKSQMFFDNWSLGSAQRMVDWIFGFYGWNTPTQKVNYLLYSYEQKPGMKLGTAYTDNFLCKYAEAHEVFSAIRFVSKEKHEFDGFGTLAVLQRYAEQGLPVRIFGFPAFLSFTINQMRDLGFERLKLSPDSLVFLGGGWKGHQDKAISKPELYAMVTEYLGIPNERIRDGFGSVEHCVPYIECRHHNFHIPIWSRVFIRDVKTLAPLPAGEKGFLHFVSPYITSVPANSVLMGDLASWHKADECACGLDAPYFVIHGRAGISKNKSCAVAAAELLKGQS